ncbi:MAG: TolC family protein [Gemmatimonadetes bacterium]|nr:TolC family protein [Gemmatimonadota bacterium]MDA1102408.1 TolC family protein [Gemmatimonadota bacterium]
MSAFSRPRCLTIATVMVLFVAPQLRAQSSETIALHEVLQLLQERNPRLQALGAAAEAAAFREPEASTLPDPILQFGVMNFGVPNLNADMAMSMAPSVQLMQMVPFPGKLGLKGDIAGYGHDMALATVDESWWQLRASASALFYDLYSLDRRTEVMRETFALLQDFQQVARTMYSAGRGRQADVLRADVEVAKLDGEIRQMEAMRLAKAARLNGILARPAATVIATPTLGDLPLSHPPTDTLSRWARETRPALARARFGVDQARSRLDLAGRQIWPDFTVGLAYGQRDRGAGTERMGSVMFAFSLPVHAGSRQHALRDEAGAMERLAEADLTGSLADVDAHIGVLLADMDRARTLVVLYRDEVIPQARATVESASSSYRVGAVDFMTLVDAQMTVNQYAGELFVLLADYGRAVSALESTVGRTLPRNGPILSEER